MYILLQTVNKYGSLDTDMGMLLILIIFFPSATIKLGQSQKSGQPLVKQSEDDNFVTVYSV